MTILLGICAVIVTATFVMLSVAAIRALNRFGETAAQLEQTSRRLDETLAGVQSVTREARDLVASAGTIVPHAKRVAEGFERVGDRAVGLGQTLLDQVEAPVMTAARLVRSVRYTAGSLLEKLARRERAGTNNGGYQP